MPADGVGGRVLKAGDELIDLPVLFRDQFDLEPRMRLAQQGRDVLRLPERELALAGRGAFAASVMLQ